MNRHVEPSGEQSKKGFSSTLLHCIPYLESYVFNHCFASDALFNSFNVYWENCRLLTWNVLNQLYLLSFLIVFPPAFIQLVWEATVELELFELLGTWIQWPTTVFSRSQTSVEKGVTLFIKIQPRGFFLHTLNTDTATYKEKTVFSLLL